MRIFSILIILTVLIGCAEKVTTDSYVYTYDKNMVYNIGFEKHKNNFRIKLYSSKPELILTTVKSGYFVISLYKINNISAKKLEELNNNFCSFVKKKESAENIDFYFDCNKNALAYPEYGTNYLDIIVSLDLL